MNINTLIEMIGDMMEMDFTETPNYAAIVALRDAMAENHSMRMANEIVSKMNIDVSACSTAEEAAELGRLWAGLMDKFIDTMYDAGFDEKNIITMASEMKLTFTNE